MQKLFMCLLRSLESHGKITEANMYKDGTYSNITVKTPDGIYRVSISKEMNQELTEKSTEEV